MNSLVTKRKALTVLLAVIAAVCLACALAISATTEKAFAQSGDGETPTERTPVVTYIIGDSTVTDESGFTFDEAANTYTYKEHAAGWSAALANSAELYNAENADANLVKVQLASDWVAQQDIAFTTSFGTGIGFSDGRLALTRTSQNVILNLNGFAVNRNLFELETGINSGNVVVITNGILEITDESETGNGKVTGGNSKNTAAGIHIDQGKLILSNGYICDNKGTSYGGGICLRADKAQFIMNGGIICRNIGYDGAGICIMSGSKAQIHNGKIQNNTASNIGGGMRISSPNVDINGKISITENTSVKGGGGIYCSQQTNLQGTVVIKDNINTGAKNQDNVWLVSNQRINITGSLIGSEIYIASENNNPISTESYALFNSDENGVAIDPNNYFLRDTMSFILDATGEIRFTNQGALELSVTGKDGAAIEGPGYGATIIYSENQITGISLKQGETQISDITVKKADSEESINLSTNPLTDAGTYYATATVKGIGNAEVEVKFTIVILPYNIEGKTSYTLTVPNDWTREEGEDNYTATYKGSNKDKPILAVQLNNEDFSDTNYTISYLLNGEPVNELKEVGTYTVVITGTGNYTGTVYATELFIIEQNTETSYIVTWQYYDGKEWKNLADSDGAVFTYTSADFSNLVRIVLIAEGLETRYVYADGVTEYHLADGENANDVAFDLAVGIDKDGETVILTAGTYALALNGTPNYVVAEQDTTSAVTVAPYNLANIVSGSADTANINAALNNTTYNAQAKELSLTVSFVLNGNVVNLTDADYDYVVKYLKDGEETEVEQFILGGTYKVYIISKNANFTGTPGVAGTFTINQANNRVTLSNIGNWLYGNYDERINHFEWNAAWLYDGTIAGTEQAYVYFTVMSDGEAVNETLTRFSKITDEIKAALNALDAGNYTLLAEADETASYTGAQDTVAFEIVKATNSFVVEPSVVEWKWNGFDKNINQLFLGSVYGNNTAVKTVKDGSGNAVAGLESFVEITDEIAAKLNALDAGSYTVTVVVADTANYSGLEKTVGFTVHKADNGWDTPLDIYSWTWGEYKDDNGIVGTAISGGEVYCTITDRNTGNVIAGYEHIAVGTSLKDLPAGSYVLTGYVDESKNYAAYSSSFNFNVYKAQNAWTSLPGIQSWVAGYYDETENAVGGVAEHGTVSYKITDENGNVVTDLANAEVGKYTLTMTVEGTDNYEGLTYTATFNVFESRDLKGGEIAGITIASVVVAGLAAAVIVLLIKRRKTV